MKKRNVFVGGMLASALLPVVFSMAVRAAEVSGWVTDGDGEEYWYEDGVKQGTENRGKEIYDPASKAWYWLDAVDGGKKAVGKDVYQESEAGIWAENEDGTGKWVRYDSEGHMVKGWHTNEKGTYYFDLTYGTMAKGMVEIDGSAYYFDPADGTMVTGRIEVGGVPCYFQEDTGKGADLVWIVTDGNEYWYEKGMRQGMEGRGREIHDPISDAWYWLDAVDGGKKAVSKDVYQESDAGIWAENEDGTGKWVRYDSEGHMVKEWDVSGDGIRYFDPVYGTMAKGTVEIEGETYVFDERTGLLQSEHTHSYTGKIVPATKEEQGYTLYICRLCGESYRDNYTDYKPTEEQVYLDMIALKKDYPEGMRWTNDNFYEWRGGIYSGGYGCAGFAFMLSDAAFGNSAARMIEDISNIRENIRVGDIIRMPGHSVIVLKVEEDGVVIAEGNYNDSVHWGRKLEFSVISQSAENYMTRYSD